MNREVDLSPMQDMLNFVASKYIENYLMCACVGFIIIWILMDFIFKEINENQDEMLIDYGYEDYDSPANWPQRYPLANGKMQSPINLVFKNAIHVLSERKDFLKFSMAYDEFPTVCRLFNNGYNVVLDYQWNNGEGPKVCGGPLNESYRFVNAEFRWGWNSYEGTEHMVDDRRHSMELQLLFVKNSFKSQDILEAAESDSLLIFSYHFKESSVDNCYLEPIVAALDDIQTPMTSICVEPAPISLIAPQFSRNYYYYVGSLTFPPCTEGVRWIVQPEPVVISPEQVQRFRELCGWYGISKSNVRPVQKVNDRDVIFYN